MTPKSRLETQLPEELLASFRTVATLKFEGKRDRICKATTEAIQLWLSHPNQKEFVKLVQTQANSSA